MRSKRIVGLVFVLVFLSIHPTRVEAAGVTLSGMSNVGSVIVDAPIYETPNFEDKILLAIPAGSPISITGITSNGWYEVSIGDNYFYTPQAFISGAADNNEVNVYSFNEGIAAIQEGLKKHCDTIIIKTFDYNLQNQLNNYFKSILRSKDIKTYAQGNMFGYAVSSTGSYKGKDFRGTLKLTVTYSDTKEEAAYTEAAVAMLVPEMKKAGNTYQQIKAVHDYICNIADYDWTYAQDAKGYVYGSAYDCLVNHVSVCTGYSLLFQKFMEQMEIPCFYVADDNHSWNIVYVDGAWYQIDCTWDGQYQSRSYEFFLTGQDEKHAYQGSIPISVKNYKR